MTQRAPPAIQTKRAALNDPLLLSRKQPDRCCKDKASPSAKANPNPGCCGPVTWREVTPLGSRGRVAPWDAAAASPCGTTASGSEGSKLVSCSSSNSSKSLRRRRRWHEAHLLLRCPARAGSTAVVSPAWAAVGNGGAASWGASAAGMAPQETPVSPGSPGTACKHRSPAPLSPQEYIVCFFSVFFAFFFTENNLHA